MKEFWKSVNIWRSYEQEFNVLFFDSRCIGLYFETLSDNSWSKKYVKYANNSDK